MRSFLTPILVAVVFTLSVTVQSAHARYDGGPSQPVNANCPIGKEPVDGKTFVTYQGRTVGFCCPGCDKQFQAWSKERKDAFLAAAMTSGKQPVAVPAKAWTEPYSLSKCVVSGELLGSMGDPVVKHYMGREVRLCCGGCVRKFEKNQMTYLQKIDEHVVHDQLRFYPLKTCVVTGKPLVVGNKDMARNVVVGNRLFRVATEGAEKKLKNDPGTHLAKLNAAVVKEQRPSYPLETCVVAGGKLGSMGKPTEMVLAGRLLRFCCGGCEPKVKANPNKFLSQLDQAWKAKGKYPKPTSRPNEKKKEPRSEGTGDGKHDKHDH